MIDTDLVLGEGEWKNMQSVVRKSFASLLEQSKQQQAVIKELQHQMKSIQTQLSSKCSRDEMIRMITIDNKLDIDNTKRIEDHKQQV